METSKGNSLCSYHQQTKMSFFLNKIIEQEGGKDPVWGVGTSRERKLEGEYIANKCPHACKWKNGSLEIIPKLGLWEIKESNGGVNSTMMYLIYCKNFGKCHNVPPAQH
jgi:hypothetical protein